MSKTYIMKFRTDILVRTEVSASTVEEAQHKAEVKFHDDIRRGLHQIDTSSAVVDVIHSDFFEVDGEPA
jgi:hypothetical protein